MLQIPLLLMKVTRSTESNGLDFDSKAQSSYNSPSARIPHDRADTGCDPCWGRVWGYIASARLRTVYQLGLLLPSPLN